MGCGPQGEGEPNDSPTQGIETSTPGPAGELVSRLYLTERAGYSGWGRHAIDYQTDTGIMSYQHYGEAYGTAELSGEDQLEVNRLVRAADLTHQPETYPMEQGVDYYTLSSDVPVENDYPQFMTVEFGPEMTPPELLALQAGVEALMYQYFSPPTDDYYQFSYREINGMAGYVAELKGDSESGQLTYQGPEEENIESAIATDSDLTRLLDHLIAIDFWQLEREYPTEVIDATAWEVTIQMGEISKTVVYSVSVSPDRAKLAMVTAEFESLILKYFDLP